MLVRCDVIIFNFQLTIFDIMIHQIANQPIISLKFPWSSPFSSQSFQLTGLIRGLK